MFRFWHSDSRTNKDTTVTQVVAEHSGASIQSLKRPIGEGFEACATSPCGKRVRREGDGAGYAPQTSNAQLDTQTLRDRIEQILGTEILSKHNEKRLIDQELAKCQIALEQLRRCHLIPYPITSKIPCHRADVSNGAGATIMPKSGNQASRWASPFGVADGPYTRHYERWLLQHPDFGSPDEVSHFHADLPRNLASVAEGRTTRNSTGEVASLPRGRLVRGADIGMHATSTLNSRGEPKKKPGPCILKRSDGQWVKLVCVTCHREDFSSTQGFINHCRIAHKNEFKSHEEAAVKCGQPIDAAESKVTPRVEDAIPPQVPQAPQPATVHPFATRHDLTEQEAYVALSARIAASMDLVRQGRLCDIKAPPSFSQNSQQLSSGANCHQANSETPHLSRLLSSRQFEGSLEDLLKDVKAAVPLVDETSDTDSDGETPVSETPIARLPVVKRVPARSAQSPLPSSRPVSHKGYGASIDIPTHKTAEASRTPDDVDAAVDEPSLSPNTLISNNAPSLVSDDGEYDSDEGSSVVSSQSDGSLEAESVSDVAEINIEDEHDSRDLRRPSTVIPSTVRLRKDDAKAVPFVSTVAGGRTERRRRMA